MSPARRRGLAVVAALALVLGLVAPGPGTFATHLVGLGGVDQQGTLWTWHQLALALGEPARLVHTPDLYAPWGYDLYRTTGLNLVDAALALPFAGFGRVAGANLAMLAILTLDGAAGAWVAARRSRDPEAPALVGLATALAPLVLYELVEGRPAQALVAPVLVTLDALLPPAAAPIAWRRVAVGVALSCLTYWFYGLFVALAALAVAALAVARGARGDAGRALAGVAVAAVVVSPLAAPLAWEAWSGTAPGLADGSTALLVHSFQPLLGVVTAEEGRELVGVQRAVPVAAGLALAWGLVAARGRAARAAILLLALALAVGPRLHLPGGAVDWAPWALARALIPVLARLWHPARALVLVLALTVLALAEAPRWLRAALVALGLGEAALDGLVPTPATARTVDAVDRCLAVDPDGIVLELPLVGSQARLVAQTVHGHPTSAGMNVGVRGFQPDASRAFWAEDPWMRAVDAAAHGVAADAAADPGPAGALGFRYVVFRRAELGAAPDAVQRRAERSLRELLGAPLWSDARSLLWAPWSGRSPCADSAVAPDVVPAPPLPGRWVRELWRRPVG